MGKVQNDMWISFCALRGKILHSFQILCLAHPTPLCPFSIWNWEWFTPKELLPCTPEGIFKLEILNFQLSFALKQHCQLDGAEILWAKHVSQCQYRPARKMTLVTLTVFGFISTYTCKTIFSRVNAIKTGLCSTLTDEKLHECLGIAFITHDPNYTELAKSRLCDFSH